MNALVRKAVADVTRRMGRTILMVLAIALGVMGITAVNQASSQIGGTFLYNTDPSAIPSISLMVDTSRVPAAALTAIQRLSAVQKLQLRSVYSAPWQLNGRAADHTMSFFAYPDAQTPALWPFEVASGRLPGPGEIVLDSRNVQEGYPVTIGATISVAAPDGHLVPLRVVGMSRTRGWSVVGAGLSANPFGYVSQATLRAISQAGGKDQERIELLVKTPDAAVAQTYQRMTQILQQEQVLVDFKSSWRYASGSAATQLSVTGPLAVIQALAILSLLLVCALIFNAVTTLLAEQIQVIGTMKALGGTRGRIIGSYLLTIALYSIAGSALGLEAGLLGGYQLAALLTSTVQLSVGGGAVTLDAGPFQLSWQIVLSSITVGLLVPQVAALWPLWLSTRITVREALAAYGVQKGGQRAFTRAWGRTLRWVPQIVWLGLRGLFRRPSRVTFTLIALSLSAAIFLAVQMGNASLALAAAEEIAPIANPDVRVDMSGSSQQAVTAIRELPNVKSVVPVTFADAILGQRRIFLTAVPPDQYQASIVSGRWLHAHEQGSIVLNEVAAQRLHLNVGGEIALAMTIRAQHTITAEVRWTIVGLLHASDYVSGSADAQGALGEAFVTPETLNSAGGRVADFTDRLIVHAQDVGPLPLQRLKARIIAILAHFGMEDAQVRTIQELGQGFTDPLPTFYSLFYAVAVVLAVVGLLSLALTLAASVLEHRLEIGVLRALGASGWQVGIVFCVEGLSLALLACALGILFGLPGGVVLIHVLATFLGLLDVTLPVWLLLSTVLFVSAVALLASLGPSLLASRLRVHSILQYE